MRATFECSILGRDARLVEEHLLEARILRVLGQDHLDDHHALEAEAAAEPGEPHRGHAAVCERAQQLVPVEPVAGLELRGIPSPPGKYRLSPASKREDRTVTRRWESRRDQALSGSDGRTAGDFRPDEREGACASTRRVGERDRALGARPSSRGAQNSTRAEASPLRVVGATAAGGWGAAPNFSLLLVGQACRALSQSREERIAIGGSGQAAGGPLERTGQARDGLRAARSRSRPSRARWSLPGRGSPAAGLCSRRAPSCHRGHRGIHRVRGLVGSVRGGGERARGLRGRRYRVVCVRRLRLVSRRRARSLGSTSRRHRATAVVPPRSRVRVDERRRRRGRGERFRKHRVRRRRGVPRWHGAPRRCRPRGGDGGARAAAGPTAARAGEVPTLPGAPCLLRGAPRGSPPPDRPGPSTSDRAE